MNTTEQWKRDGCLIVRGQFDQAQIRKLREVCEPALEQWRRESVKEGEPGGFCHGPQAWVMLHLNHPKYHREHPERLAWLLNAVADPRATRILRDIFREQATVMQINYYIDPSESRQGNWHRDCQFFPGATEANEPETLAREADPPREIHMHIPLVPTAASEVVPGSHVRGDTADERRVRRENPGSDEMPNALRIRLEPGDLAFFHVNSLHRGLYPAGVPRRTIAVTFGRVSDPRPASAEMMKQWNGYVATYQPWFLREGYLDGCTPAARAFYERFIEVYGDNWRPEYLALLPPVLQAYFTST